jgi:predicted ATPase
LVAGEAGVGKTRLVEEVIRSAAAQGATVLRGRCYEFGSGVPYQPIADALRSILDSRHATPDIQYLLSNVQPVWLAELSRLLPELRQLCPGLPEPIPMSGEATQQRLFEAVARFLQAAVGGRQSAVVFLDDLHWADTSTLDLLHYLVRQLGGTPVWIVSTYRLEEVDLSHPLTRLRQGLSRDHLVDLLSLEPLSPAAVGEIARSLAGEEAETDLGAFLYRESEGNPLFLVEAVSDLQEQGALRGGEDGCWQWVGPPEAGLVLSEVEGTLPTGVRDVVLQRVGRLSEPAQRLLTLAAVIGRGFDAALLEAAAGRDAAAVDESLDEWLTRRLVQLHSASALQLPTSNLQPPISNLQYDFSHDKIRATVYHAAGPARRRMLHRRVGTALENLYADRLGDVYEQLAHHYEQAGAVEQALTYLPLAAAKSTAVYAHQEALAYYDRALALLAEEDARRWEITLQRGKSLHSLAQYDDAITVCQQVVRAESTGDRLLAARAANELSAICRAHRDYEEARAWSERAQWLAGEAGDRAEQARAKQMQAEVEREQGNLESAQRLFEEVLMLHRALADQRGVAECLSGLGHLFSAQGWYDGARQRFEEALALFRALGDRQREATCLRAIGLTHWRQGANDAAYRAFTESLDTCRAIGDRMGEATSLNNLGLIHIIQGDSDETRRCWEESVALYRSLGLEKRVATSLHNLGILHADLGDYAAAQQCLEESLAISGTVGAKAREAIDLGWLGNLHLLRGEYDQARHQLKAALDLDREIGGGEEQSWHLLWLGAVAYEAGTLAEARDRLQQATQLAERQGVELRLDEAHCWLAAVHLAQGDGKAALDAARQALSNAETRGKPSEMGACYAMLGAVYGSGLIEEAEDPASHFERALALVEGGKPFEYGVALRRYGAYLLRSGDPEQGRAYLQEAQGIFERIGARGELTKVTRLLAGDDAYHLR